MHTHNETSIDAEAATLQAEIRALKAEIKSFNDEVALTRSYASIGIETLSPDDSQNYRRLLRATKENKEKLDAKLTDLARRADAHIARQRAIIDSVAKETNFLQEENSRRMAEEVNRISGLISYAQAVGGVDDKAWSFAQSVIRDFRESTSYESRSGNYTLLSRVIASIK